MSPLLPPNTPRPLAALFDIDGTLFDTERLWAEALSLVFEALGARQSARRLMAITYGLAWPDAYAALRAAFPETLAGLSEHELGHRLCCRFDELFALAPPVIPGAVRLLRAFHAAAIPCVYVSGSPRSTIERNLRRCALEGLFRSEACVPSDDAPRGKPAPDGYLLALERLGLTPAQALAFEDSRVGSRAALAAGLRTFVCPPPGAPAQDYPAAAVRLGAWEEAAEEVEAWGRAPTLRVHRLHPAATLPRYAHAGDAGLDLAACEACTLAPGAWAAIPTGLQLQLPPGTEAQVRARSGLAARFGIAVLNAPGTIDEGYRGEVRVLLVNHGRDPFRIEPGMRIAQLVIAPVLRVALAEGPLDQATERGCGGFGSSGLGPHPSAPAAQP